MKQSAFIFNSSNTINDLIIIYEHAFSNVFHISNLNKDITATTISRDTFSHHAIVDCGSERESSDIHMLQRNPARAILQGRPPA